MAGFSATLKARTKTELKRKAQKWTKEAREQGLDIVFGWDPDHAVKTDDGYSIFVRAHS